MIPSRNEIADARAKMLHNHGTNSNVFNNFANAFMSNSQQGGGSGHDQNSGNPTSPGGPLSAIGGGPHHRGQFGMNSPSASPINLPNMANNQQSETTNYWGGGGLDQNIQFGNNTGVYDNINSPGGMFMLNGSGSTSNTPTGIGLPPHFPTTRATHSPTHPVTSQAVSSPFNLFGGNQDNSALPEINHNSQSPSPLPRSHTPPSSSPFLRPQLAGSSKNMPFGMPQVSRNWPPTTSQNGSIGGSPSRPQQGQLPNTLNRARVFSTNSNSSNTSNPNNANAVGVSHMMGLNPPSSLTTSSIGVSATQPSPSAGMAGLASGQTPRNSNANSTSSTTFQYNSPNSGDNFSFDTNKTSNNARPPQLSQHRAATPPVTTAHNQNASVAPATVNGYQHGAINFMGSHGSVGAAVGGVPRSSSVPPTSSSSALQPIAKPVPQVSAPIPSHKQKYRTYSNHQLQNTLHRDRLEHYKRIEQDETEWYSLRIGGQEGKVRNLSPKLWDYTKLTRLDMKHNNIRKIPNEVSNLKNLMQFDISYNQIKTLPGTLGSLLELRELNISHNQIRNLPLSLGRLFNLQSLSIDGNQISHDYVGCLKRDNGIRLLLDHLYEAFLNLQHNYEAFTQKPERHWKQIQQDLSQFNDDRPHPISVMTYNVLSDKYATAQQYGYCPGWALNWDYRRDKLLEELGQYAPDIVCLQELEKSVYRDFKQLLSDSYNYNSVFAQKGRAKTMDPEKADHVDGCAIFFKSELLKPVLKMTVNFTRIACKLVEGRHSQDMLINRTMTKDNIGLLVVFEIASGVPGSPPKHVLIANAHLHWDPEFCDIKLVQSIILLNAIQKMRRAAVSNPDKLKEQMAKHQRDLAAENGKTSDEGGRKTSPFNDLDFDDDLLSQLPLNNLLGQDPEQIPVILAGDFNSLPESGVLEFVQNGCVRADHREFLGYAYGKHFQLLSQQQLTLKMAKSAGVDLNVCKQKEREEILHNLCLDSAYADFLESTPFSNFTYEFKGMIDYIFYSKHLLTLTGVLQGVSQAWFDERKIPGCPFISIPSDHLPLLSEFAFKSQKGPQPLQQAPQNPNPTQPIQNGPSSFQGNPRTGSFGNANVMAQMNNGASNWGNSGQVPRSTWGAGPPQAAALPDSNKAFGFSKPGSGGSGFPW